METSATLELAELRTHDPALADAAERVLLRDRPFVQALALLVRHLHDGTASPEEEESRGVLAWMERGNRRQVEAGLRGSSRDADFVLRGYLEVEPERLRLLNRHSRRSRPSEGEGKRLWRGAALEALFLVLREPACQSKDCFEPTLKDCGPYRSSTGDEPAFPPALLRYLSVAVRNETERIVADREIADDMWRRWRTLGFGEPISISDCADSLPVEWDSLDDLAAGEEMEELFAVVQELLHTGTECDREVICKLAAGEPVATSPTGKVALQTLQRKARLRRQRRPQNPPRK